MKSVRRGGKPEINYPCLMINQRLSIIVLLEKESCGVVVDASWLSFSKVGEYCKTWRMDSFIPFNGEIDLSNTNNEFPCLMIGDDKEQIILFTEVGKGVVVRSVDPFYPVGKYCNDWLTSYFKHYAGFVTLSNENLV